MGYGAITDALSDSVEVSYIEIALLFGLTSVLGISTALRLGSIQPAAPTTSSPIFLTMGVIASAITLVYLYRDEKFELVEAWFSVVYMVTGFVVFDMYIPTLGALLLSVLSVLVFRRVRGFGRNVVSAVFFSGAIAMLSVVLSLEMAAVFLVLYALYDIFMFYRGPVEEIVESGSDFFPGFRTDNVVLGAGDVIVPVSFSAAVLSYSLSFAALSAAGAFLGLLVAFSVPKRSFPASPVVSLFAFVGFVAGFLL